jgi:nucleoside-diphosphate-sugar epimerase
MSQLTILLTGANGFIGSHLLKALLAENYRVLITTRQESDNSRITGLLPKVKIYGTDINDLRKAFSEQKIDCVIHLAANYLKNHTHAEEVTTLLNSNVVFPATILDLMREYGVRSFINTGTFFEYDLKEKKILTEKSPIQPFNMYAESKILFSELTQNYTKQYGLSTVYLRLFAPYGPSDNDKLIVSLIKNLMAKKSIQLSPSEQEWNFTYVSDIVEAYLLAIKYVCVVKPGYEIFNIGINETVKVKTVAEIIEKELGLNGLVDYDKPYAKNEIFYANCSAKKASKLLNWKAKISIDQGLRLTVDYYRNQK